MIPAPPKPIDLQKEFTTWLYYFERLYPSMDSPSFDDWRKAREEYKKTINVKIVRVRF